MRLSRADVRRARAATFEGKRKCSASRGPRKGWRGGGAAGTAGSQGRRAWSHRQWPLPRRRPGAGRGRRRPPSSRLLWRLTRRGSTMSAEVPEAASAEEQKEMEDKVTSPEKAEEAKLKARYPHLGQKPGGSDFLRKRLQKGQKYFDSGDYNMAKAKMKNKQLPTATPDKTEVTGDHIPTPQDLPQRKPSLVTSKLAG